MSRDSMDRFVQSVFGWDAGDNAEVKMARGGYLGGSTVVGPRSGWFSFGKAKKSPKMARIAGQDRFAVIQREKREAIKAAKAERVKRAAERRRAAKAAEAKRKAENAARRREEQAGKKQQRKDEMEKRKRIIAKGLTGVAVVRRKTRSYRNTHPPA